MAETYGFFDGDAEYGQEEFNQYFNAFLRSGVMVEDSGQMGMKVSRSSSTGNIAYQVAGWNGNPERLLVPKCAADNIEPNKHQFTESICSYRDSAFCERKESRVGSEIWNEIFESVHSGSAERQ